MAEAGAQAHHEEGEELTPRSDLWAGAIPGLLPALLGIGMMLLGA
jgi:hypothetical protein